MKHTLVFHTIKLGKAIQNAVGVSGFPYSLNYTQASTILFIENANSSSQSQIASHLHLKPASIVTLIDDLEKLKLVERKSTNGDRRKYKITLTEKGKAIVKLIEKKTYDLDNFLKKAVSSEEFHEFNKTLDKLIVRLNDWKGGEK